MSAPNASSSPPLSPTSPLQSPHEHSEPSQPLPIQHMLPNTHPLVPPPITFEPYLDLSFTPVDDLVVRLHAGLEDLDLTGNKLRACPSLRHLDLLNTLCLRQNLIPTLVDLLPGTEGSDENRLTSLNMYDNRLVSTEGVQHLTNLTYLDFSFNELRKIDGLRPLVKLRELYLIENKITEINTGLQDLLNLNLLELGSNRIRKIENLGHLRNLTKLFLGRNKITKIEGLETLTKLRSLSLQFNRLTVIEGLDQLTELQELYLSNNGLTALGGLESLAQLRILDVGYNFIEHIDGVQCLVNLEDFWCQRNPISSISELEPLKTLPNLQTVYLEHSPLYRTQPDYRITVLFHLPNLLQIDADTVTRSEQVTVAELKRREGTASN